MADWCSGPVLCRFPSPSPPPFFFLRTPNLQLQFSSKSMAVHCHRSSNPRPTQPSLLVFSGGTAFNGVVEEFKKLTNKFAHVLPVSDDGGSTAEIVRVLVPGLHSRITRVFYMSSEGRNLLHEVFPSANPAVLDQLRNVDCIMYAMGSLFTSVCPSLVLLGIGEIISSRSCPKHLPLRLLFKFSTENETIQEYELSESVCHAILVPKDSEIPRDVQCLPAQRISDVVLVISIHDPKVGIIFDPEALINALGNVVSRYLGAKG
ncbi:hypothetical protein SLA2020_044300 [Shorea laevis]